VLLQVSPVIVGEHFGFHFKCTNMFVVRIAKSNRNGGVGKEEALVAIAVSKAHQIDMLGGKTIALIVHDGQVLEGVPGRMALGPSVAEKDEQSGYAPPQEHDYKWQPFHGSQFNRTLLPLSSFFI